MKKGKEIVLELEDKLTEIAKEIIKDNNRLPLDYKERFYKNPDSVEEHDPNWHQWGIITHSIKFREMYDKELKKYLKKWNLYRPIKKYLQEKIDGMPKEELIRISMPLHDLGKFRKGIKKRDGKIKFDFSNHEKISQKIILSQNIKEMLKNYGLTDKQIEYIAKCAGNHYELGFIREKAKKSDLGYTIKFAKSPYFLKEINSQLSIFKGFEVEVGLLFLADSLAKTDIIIPAKNDKEIEKYSVKAEQEIEERGLNPKLINAIKQRPVNIAIAKEYLSMVFDLWE